MASFQIAETNEDGYSENTDEHVNPSTATFGVNYLGRFSIGGGSIPHDGGWIFRSTGIPQGSTIDSCTISLNKNNADNQSGTPDGSWYGYAVDSPSDFSAAHTHRTSDHHTRTTASVVDNIPNEDPHVSPSLVTIAQEIVDRAGFSGDIGFTWRSTGSTDEWFPWTDYSNSSGGAATLTITWTEGGGSVTLDAQPGTYSITGTASGLRTARKIAAVTGMYVITGVAASLRANRRLSAVSGSYLLAGFTAGLRRGVMLAAVTGSYTITRSTAGLRVARHLAAVAGVYVLTGIAASIRANRHLTAVAGSYTITGLDAALQRGYRLIADAGEYVVTGVAAALRSTRTLQAASGVYSVMGATADLVWSGAVVVASTFIPIFRPRRR